MHCFVLFKICESGRGFFFGNLGIFTEGGKKAFHVKILCVVGIFVDDFLHGFPLPEGVNFCISIT